MKIRLWPTILILIVVAVTVRLGFWQGDRAHQKEALNAHIVAFENAPAQRVGAQPMPLQLQSIEFHRVEARGEFLPDRVVFLDNRPYNDQPGFYVVMPLKLEGGGVVLVNRGWLPRNLADRTGIEHYDTPKGIVDVQGIARANATQAFELGHGGSAAHQEIRQNLDVASYAKETGLALQPFVIQQTNDTGDKLVRDWPAPTMGVERNYGYMLQWWGMAVVAIGFGLYAARRAAKKAKPVRPRKTNKPTLKAAVERVSRSGPRTRNRRKMQTQTRHARQPANKGSWNKGRWMLALVCAVPVIASYLMYYVFKPAGGTTSYGTLIDPQRPIPAQLIVTDEKGQSMPLKSLQGKWLMVIVNGSDCDEQCATRLYFMRQVRVLQSCERDRVVNIWLRTDDKPVSDVIKTAYPQPDTRMLVADGKSVAAWLPVDDGTKLTDHIFLVDPNGNLMMRFPKNPDPKKINADLGKLLKWSRIG